MHTESVRDFEDLSAVGASRFHSRHLPERIIASVRSAVSRSVMPRQQIAIARALIW